MITVSQTFIILICIIILVIGVTIIIAVIAVYADSCFFFSLALISALWPNRDNDFYIYIKTIFLGGIILFSKVFCRADI